MQVKLAKLKRESDKLPLQYCFIEFIDNSIDEAKTMFIKLTPDNIKYLNEATINTANYFVISNKPFTIPQNTYLYNRFKNKNWIFSKPHFNI